MGVRDPFSRIYIKHTKCSSLVHIFYFIHILSILSENSGSFVVYKEATFFLNFFLLIIICNFFIYLKNQRMVIGPRNKSLIKKEI